MTTPSPRRTARALRTLGPLALAGALVTSLAAALAPQGDPFEEAEQLLARGRAREALERLAAVPWLSPRVMEAKQRIAEICTRLPPPGARGPLQGPAVDTVEVLETLPNDAACYTQGFEATGEEFLVSCGLYGQSRVRRVDRRSGRVLAERHLDPRVFGEGLTRFAGRVFVLSWVERDVFVLDAEWSTLNRAFRIDGEGWGLTHDATSLISSHGTNELRFLDPATGAVRRTVRAVNGDLPLLNLNELEFVRGEIWANIYPIDRIARIDPATGEVRGWVLAESVLPVAQRQYADVMNGIAYDPATESVFLTGKLWPRVYRVRPRPARRGDMTSAAPRQSR